MRLLAFFATLALSGCSDPIADAERELAIVQKSHGSSEEVCQAKRKIADAALKAQDEKRYQVASLEADICRNEINLRRLRP